MTSVGRSFDFTATGMPTGRNYRWKLYTFVCETTKYEVEMKRLNNERGVALVMALILTLIILAAVSALLYLVTQGTMMSGYQKRYQTALEAAKGGMELATKEIISRTIASAISGSIPRYRRESDFDEK